MNFKSTAACNRQIQISGLYQITSAINQCLSGAANLTMAYFSLSMNRTSWRTARRRRVYRPRWWVILPPSWYLLIWSSGCLHINRKYAMAGPEFCQCDRNSKKQGSEGRPSEDTWRTDRQTAEYYPGLPCGESWMAPHSWQISFGVLQW